MLMIIIMPTKWKRFKKISRYILGMNATTPSAQFKVMTS
jgi:hypothetical protein